MIATLLVCALAAYRLARVVTTDTISAPFRDRLFSFAYDEENSVVQTQGTERVYVAAPRAPWRTWAFELFSCPLCLGVWVSAGVYSAWRWWDTTAVHAVIAVFAIAGVQCFLALRED